MYFPSFFLVIASSVSVRFEPLPLLMEVEERVEEGGVEEGGEESSPCASLRRRSKWSAAWTSIARICSRDWFSSRSPLPREEAGELGLVPLSALPPAPPLSPLGALSTSSRGSEDYRGRGRGGGRGRTWEEGLSWLRREDLRVREREAARRREACDMKWMIGVPALATTSCVCALLHVNHALKQDIAQCKSAVSQELQHADCFFSSPPSPPGPPGIKLSDFCRSTAEVSLRKCTPFSRKVVREMERRQEVEGWRGEEGGTK